MISLPSEACRSKSNNLNGQSSPSRPVIQSKSDTLSLDVHWKGCSQLYHLVRTIARTEAKSIIHFWGFLSFSSRKLIFEGRQVGIGAATDLKKLTGGIVEVVLHLLASPSVSTGCCGKGNWHCLRSDRSGRKGIPKAWLLAVVYVVVDVVNGGFVG